jgi:16S rRNA (guanine527-N7)-methyltransferase
VEHGPRHLLQVLEAAQDKGFLGPGPIDAQLAHAQTFAALLDPPAGPFLDLGSGGGLPGLVIADAWPDSTGVLLDSQERRGAFLARAVLDLGLDDRIRVITARAEDAARDPDLRGTIALVVARSFGPPAVTAECAVGFLAPDARLAVSEPPNADPTTRWPTATLAELGLIGPEIRRAETTTLALFTHPDATPDRYPRRAGIPSKRPLF